jgi:DNA recombination protein RmuC
MDSLLPVITFIAGLAAGLAVAFLGRRMMSDHFRALSSDALNASTDQFLKLAEARFKTLQTEGLGDLDKRTLAINEIIKPVDAQLQALNNTIQQISGTDKSLGEQIANLQKETAKIAGALNNPRERGRSAEILLERLFEHAGLLRDIHYRSQVVQGSIRPDFIIDLEGSLRVVIDAKAPLLDVMEDLEDPERQKEAAAKLAYQVREHIKSLSGKRYNDIVGSVDFTVLFLPGDGLYALAVESDRDLIDFAARHNIVLSSPMLLFGLLRMIHTLGRERSLNKNAEEIRALGADLHKRLSTFFKHFQNIGLSLSTMNKRYNEAVGSMNRSVLPSARRFEHLQSIPGHTALQLPPEVENASNDDENIDDRAA